jgi:hypothetical protein
LECHQSTRKEDAFGDVSRVSARKVPSAVQIGVKGTCERVLIVFDKSCKHVEHDVGRVFPEYRNVIVGKERGTPKCGIRRESIPIVTLEEVLDEERASGREHFHHTQTECGALSGLEDARFRDASIRFERLFESLPSKVEMVTD